MDTTTQILSGLFGVAMVLMIAPRVLQRNQGKVLKNAALWVAIFLGLALAYKTVGPGALPMTAAEQASVSAITPQNAASDKPDDAPPTLKEEDGFSPPRE